MDHEVLHERDGPVAIISFNRPKALNAMTTSMADAYADALRAADADPTVRAIVVTGEGRGFCAGADRSVLQGGPEEIRASIPRRENLPSLAYRLRKPVICAVNGPVAGIGLAYMMASDVRFVDVDASISSTFAQLGLVAEYGLSWILPRVTGLATSLEFLLSGRTVTGEQAQSMGLAQYLSRRTEARADAIAFARRLAEQCSPFSLATIKRQLYAGLSSDADSALTAALGFMDQSFGGPDLATALSAHVSKTRPTFESLD
jgi:enoyl-CoA hydratase/carnithine racemase